MARIIKPAPKMKSNVPPTSMVDNPDSRLLLSGPVKWCVPCMSSFRRSKKMSTAARRETGIEMTKQYRQLDTAREPPMTGPTAKLIPATRENTVVFFACSASVTLSARTILTMLLIPAALKPCKALPNNSIPHVCAAAHIVEPITMQTIEIWRAT